MEQGAALDSTRLADCQGEDRTAQRDAGIARLLSGPAPTPRAANAGGSGTGGGPDDPDAELIELGLRYDAAAALYAAKHAEMVAVSKAAEGARPGPAPIGADAYQKWRDEVDAWRDQTGVGEAEEASDNAIVALGEIEDLIAVATATTLDGLRLKARVGLRCEDVEVEWPDGLAAGLARDLLRAPAQIARSPQSGLSPAVSTTTPPAAERDLARMVVTYFGDDPLHPGLTGDIALRDRARSILAETQAESRPVGDATIAAAIKAHRTARDRLNEVVIWEDEDAPENAETKAVYDAASDAERKAFQALFGAQPATLGGLQAMLRYLAETPALDDEAEDFRRVMKAVASAAAGIRAGAVRWAPDLVLSAPSTALPAPGSEEAKAAFRAVCADADRLMQPAREGYPALKHPDGHTTWTKHGLSHALDVGEISPAEYARLYRLAAERELRMDAAALASDIGALHALAYADDYPEQASGGEAPDPAVPENAAAQAIPSEPDLKSCSIFQLGLLHESVHTIREHIADTMHTPSFNVEGQYRTLNAAGRVIDREHERLSFLFDAIEHEVRARQPADRGERDERLTLLLGMSCTARAGSVTRRCSPRPSPRGATADPAPQAGGARSRRLPRTLAGGGPDPAPHRRGRTPRSRFVPQVHRRRFPRHQPGRGRQGHRDRRRGGRRRQGVSPMKRVSVDTMGDSLGRPWPLTKLARLLGDADVQRAVAEANRVGRTGSRLDSKAVHAWAKEQGRSDTGAALLVLLCQYALFLDCTREASAHG